MNNQNENGNNSLIDKTTAHSDESEPESQPQSQPELCDKEVIDDILELDYQFSSIMQNRIDGLKKISENYKNGNYEESMAEAGLNKDLGVVNDFFRYALIKKDLNKISLKSDMVIQIFPTILNMVNCKYDVYFKTGINTAWIILNLFSDPIMDAIKAPLSGGIDLNREEKINKYKIIIDYFKRLRDSPALEQNAKYKDIKNLNLKQFIGELKFFIKNVS